MAISLSASSSLFRIKPNKKYGLLLKTGLCCVTWPAKQRKVCSCCVASPLQWRQKVGSAVLSFQHIRGKYLKGKVEPTNVKAVVLGNSEIHVASDYSGDVKESGRLRPAGIAYCPLTANVWRIPANELPQQFCVSQLCADVCVAYCRLFTQQKVHASCRTKGHLHSALAAVGTSLVQGRASVLNLSLSQAVVMYPSQQPVADIYIKFLSFRFFSKQNAFLRGDHKCPSVSLFALTVAECRQINRSSNFHEIIYVKVVKQARVWWKSAVVIHYLMTKMTLLPALSIFLDRFVWNLVQENST